MNSPHQHAPSGWRDGLVPAFSTSRSRRVGLSAALAAMMLGLIRVYQAWISPMMAPACRFYPSCSEYCRLAIGRHGPWEGLWWSARRLLRCHPWQPGGIDWPPGVHQPSCDFEASCGEFAAATPLALDRSDDFRAPAKGQA